jgi:hypothetical protein
MKPMPGKWLNTKASKSICRRGYVCHPGADPAIPGHVVPFHAGGEEWFASLEDACYEAVHAGRSIVDGTHPDLSVLSLVTGGV